MKQTQTHSNVLIAVDAEIGVLERRVAKLHEIRRLAIELDEARLPAAAAPTPRAAAPRPSPERASASPRRSSHRCRRRRARRAGRRPREHRRDPQGAAGRTRSPLRRASHGGGARAARRSGRRQGPRRRHGLRAAGRHRQRPRGRGHRERHASGRAADAIAELARTAVGLERRRVPVPAAQAARDRSLAGRRPSRPAWRSTEPRLDGWSEPDPRSQRDSRLRTTTASSSGWTMDPRGRGRTSRAMHAARSDRPAPVATRTAPLPTVIMTELSRRGRGDAWARCRWCRPGRTATRRATWSTSRPWCRSPSRAAAGGRR